jgi:hypothetical protein
MKQSTPKFSAVHCKIAKCFLYYFGMTHFLDSKLGHLIPTLRDKNTVISRIEGIRHFFITEL